MEEDSEAQIASDYLEFGQFLHEFVHEFDALRLAQLEGLQCEEFLDQAASLSERRQVRVCHLQLPHDELQILHLDCCIPGEATVAEQKLDLASVVCLGDLEDHLLAIDLLGCSWLVKLLEEATVEDVALEGHWLERLVAAAALDLGGMPVDLLVFPQDYV